MLCTTDATATAFSLFFQADDGIRDATVTGVQTCALPIFGRDNHVVFDECARQMTPHVARCAEAVQHDHCRAMTADPHMDGCTVGFDRPRLHHSREGINPIYAGMLAHLCTPGLLLVGGIGGSLRGGEPP